MATPPGFVPTPINPPTGAPAATPPAPPVLETDPPGVRDRINTLNARIHELQVQAAEVAALRTRAVLAERRADSHGLINAHPAVVEYASAQYDAYAATAGDQAKPYATWLREDAPNHPLVAPHVVKAVDPGQAPLPNPAAPPAPVATRPAPPPPANPNASTLPAPSVAPVTVFSEEAVRQWSPTQVRENLPALLSQMQAEGAVKYTPPAPRT